VLAHHDALLLICSLLFLPCFFTGDAEQAMINEMVRLDQDASNNPELSHPSFAVIPKLIVKVSCF